MSKSAMEMATRTDLSGIAAMRMSEYAYCTPVRMAMASLWEMFVVKNFSPLADGMGVRIHEHAPTG